MQLAFNIRETVETEIYYGFYTIYLLGGHHLEVDPDFYVQIINMETHEEIELTEKSLKARDYKMGRKAIKFYTFEIAEYGRFKISVHNFNDIVVKESILEFLPFPFSIPHLVLSALTGRKRKKLDINNIEILIQ